MRVALYDPTDETVLKSLKTFWLVITFIVWRICAFAFFFYFIVYCPLKKKSFVVRYSMAENGRNITFVFYPAENKNCDVNGRVKRGLERRVVNELGQSTVRVWSGWGVRHSRIFTHSISVIVKAYPSESTNSQHLVYKSDDHLEARERPNVGSW